MATGLIEGFRYASYCSFIDCRNGDGGTSGGSRRCVATESMGHRCIGHQFILWLRRKSGSGAPNATSCSDSSGQAWTHASRSLPSALTLTYATPVKASSINIVFSYDLAATLTVEVANGAGAFTLVNTITSPMTCGTGANYTLNVPVSGSPTVNTVRITNTDDSYYAEIDAVELVGTTMPVPSAPRGLKVAYTAGKSTFSWSAPASTGGSTILNYAYCTTACTTVDGVWTTLARGKLSVTLAESKGTSGRLYVRAVSANGPGASASVPFKQAK